MGPRRTRTPDRMHARNELADANRNARQKTILLCEVNRLRRTQSEAAIEEARRIADQSKKLCQKSTPAKHSKAG